VGAVTIDDFFYSESDTANKKCIQTHCYHCISSETLPTDDNLEKTIKSIRLSNTLDIRIFRTILLNQAVRDLYEEMEKWTSQTWSTLLDQMVSDITNDTTTTEERATMIHTLDPHIQTWLHDQKLKLWNYTISHMTNTTMEETANPWCSKIIANLIAKKKLYIEKEKAKLSSDADQELLVFKNDLKVRNDTEKACLEEQVIANLCKQTMALNSPKCKSIKTTKKVGKKKQTILDLNSLTPSLSPLPNSHTTVKLKATEFPTPKLGNAECNLFYVWNISAIFSKENRLKI
jgi:hypothetical protein